MAAHWIRVTQKWLRTTFCTDRLKTIMTTLLSLTITHSEDRTLFFYCIFCILLQLIIVLHTADYSKEEQHEDEMLRKCTWICLVRTDKKISDSESQSYVPVKITTWRKCNGVTKMGVMRHILSSVTLSPNLNPL